VLPIIGEPLNKAGLLLLVMVNASNCVASSGGPALIAVATRALCGPASSFTAGGSWAVKTGTSLTAVTLMAKVCGALVSMPPLAVPPSSIRVRVILALPLASAAGV